MKDFKEYLDNCDEKFGALEEGDNANVVIRTKNDIKIETDIVGVEYDRGVCRHFTWREFDWDGIEEAIEGEEITMEEVIEEGNVEFDETILVMDGFLPWENVESITSDMGGLFK